MLKKLALILSLPIALISSQDYYTESLFPEWTQSFQIDKVLFEAKSDEQHIIIFENPLFGRVLALDGIIQVTENDEYVYHEMLAHVPIFSHGKNISNLFPPPPWQCPLGLDHWGRRRRDAARSAPPPRC